MAKPVAGISFSGTILCVASARADLLYFHRVGVRCAKIELASRGSLARKRLHHLFWQHVCSFTLVCNVAFRRAGANGLSNSALPQTIKPQNFYTFN